MADFWVRIAQQTLFTDLVLHGQDRDEDAF